MQLILEYSVIEFNQKKYQQQFGTSMRWKPDPPYANIFMARNIDKEILKIFEQNMENGEISVRLMKRFLDDFFLNSLDWYKIYMSSFRN